ncbi:TlpA family protein disulfide reductase [Pedobacter fastidiosus]|uniref:TlpA family protein disulfide reductase n=1 Tax=Pedobacter fastidiosus TaxID=2765361 RepID=A0ABR7KPA4_9SPHI|nr:TlpA disulfide reductase family protein [Pedobacter fastidiosus]MBC6109919.1 TlpA family protein disulfide reductase [Pedobacter fastidiosus]
MRNLLIIICVSTLVSCNQNSKTIKLDDSVAVVAPMKKDLSNVGQPQFPLSEITKDFLTYWTYHTHYVKLYNKFLAFDEAGKEIKKLAFLEKLKSGNYLPLLLNSKNDTLNYKLTKIPAKSFKDLSSVISNDAITEIKHFKLEGKPVPPFKFKDVNGIEYSSANTRGKIVLFKCWFIGCVACVKEMPKLNQLVAFYKNRKDIVFISLAPDNDKALKEFFTKTKFDYSIVGNQDQYISKVLDVNIFPTHIIISKIGNIVSVVNNGDDVETILNAQAKL